MQSKQPTVLVCVLNWGIGHATRCIPIIYELLAQNFNVVLCSDGHALAVLRGSFSELPFETLPGYNATYANGDRIMLKMALQLPKFIRAIKAEHSTIQKLVKKHSAAAIISDNRYGCYSAKVKSIFITHQLNILMPDGFGLLQQLVFTFNKSRIANFDSCWVPDIEGKNNLSGELSHDTGLNVDFIGILSRMKRGAAEKKYDVAAILSGPEPQRTILENIIREQLLQLNKRAIIIRGIPTSTTIKNLNELVEEADYMDAAALNELMLQSSVVVARSGYSTIMDLHTVGGKAILIPTPGQTEQQYLAKSLSEKKIAHTVSQQNLNLKEDLKKAHSAKGFSPEPKQNLLLTERIASLKLELL